jgi:hypothetical protein
LQRPDSKPQFDNAALDAMMERYRAEILRYQRATAPGKRTLAENLRDITEARTNQAEEAAPPPPKKQPPDKKTEKPDIAPAPAPEPAKQPAPAAQDKKAPEKIFPLQEEKEPEKVSPAQEEKEHREISPPKQPGPGSVVLPAAPPPDENEIQLFLPPDVVKKSAPPAPVQPKANAFLPAPLSAHTEFAKCAGAFGTFRPYDRMGRYTRASFLQNPGEAVDVMVRFSADTPAGGADAVRCRRGFSVRFFCADGRYDLLGMHLPVAMGRSADCLEACARAIRPCPKTGLRDQKRFWQFIAAYPQALHAAVWLYTDLGTVGSYRAVDGYCMPAVWVNAAGERRAARCRWLARQRPQTLTRFEAEELAGSDPDAVARDLFEALSAGERPQYELCVQLIEPDAMPNLSFDPSDPSHVCPEDRFVLQRIGLLTLERPPDNFATEVENVVMRADNLVEGIESPPAPKGACTDADDLAAAGAQLRAMGEFSRRRLAENLAEELLRLDAPLLEEVLVLFSRAELSFGQTLTSALGG